MAASIVTALGNVGLARPLSPCFFPAEEEEETEEEYEDDLREVTEDEDGGIRDSPEDGTRRLAFSPCNAEITNRLLRFADLISSDVQRYFGQSQDPDGCDIYAERLCPQIGGRQRYYADFIRVASSGQAEEPESLGPLAELFQNHEKKGQGLPMSQRRLPVSFWTEPLSHHVLDDSDPQVSSESCITHSTSLFNSTGVCSISSSSTPDFSDLLAHWALDRDNLHEITCDYSQT